ncbi:MAG: T9SS type A sorting domain-containing protein [Bacteroidetes bacterium]|nr:T9SS type A sorting domain-containing protein [Bacteroidota bacterium]
MVYLIANKDSFSFHPNPADDNVNLRFAAISKDRFILIQNMSGATMFSAEAKGTQLPIGLSEFSSGIYFIEVYENGNCTGREKLVKN